jgi:ABC-type nitrate/sulfonate/bicarbonate transport system substrate-binding protein
MGLFSRREALVSGLASCAAVAVGPQRARAQALDTVRIAYLPFQYSGQALIAQEMGFFTKAGIAAQLQQIAYGSAIAAAVASGAVDIGIATVATLAQARHKNVPFTIVAGAAEYSSSTPPVAYLMVGKQTSIHNGKDMNGKTIGTPGLATMGEYGVRAWVDANGGDSTTLKFIEIPFSQMASAFAAGRIDAAELAEPFLTDARKVARPLTGEMAAVLGSSFIITAWFAMNPWASAHADLVGRFASAMRESATWAVANPVKFIEIVTRTFGQDPSSFSRASLATFAQRTSPALVQPEINVVARYANFPAFPASDLIFKP